MPAADRKPQTLYDKVFRDHIVDERDDGTVLLYIGEPPPTDKISSTSEADLTIDRHLVHEVTSPQAFEGLKNADRKVRRPDCTLATTDHVCVTFSSSQDFC